MDNIQQKFDDKIYLAEQVYCCPVCYSELTDQVYLLNSQIIGCESCVKVIGYYQAEKYLR